MTKYFMESSEFTGERKYNRTAGLFNQDQIVKEVVRLKLNTNFKPNGYSILVRNRDSLAEFFEGDKSSICLYNDNGCQVKAIKLTVQP